MIKVSVQGATGKLGTKIVEQLKNTDGFQYSGPVLRNSVVPDCDVVAAVASDKALNELLPKLSGQKLIIEATGNLPIADIEQHAKNTSVFLVPNFLPGMQTVYKELHMLSVGDTRVTHLH